MRRIIRPIGNMFVKTGKSRFWRDRKGGAAVEFALVVPWFIFGMFAIFDLSMEYFTQAALDYATQDAARTIQINGMNGVNQSAINQQVCKDLSWLITNCSLIQTYVVTSTTYTGLTPTTLNGSGNFASTTFAPGGAQTPNLIQVGYKKNFYLMPLSGQSTVPTLVSTYVFRNE